jgi:hypothetical protein
MAAFLMVLLSYGGSIGGSFIAASSEFSRISIPSCFLRSIERLANASIYGGSSFISKASDSPAWTLNLRPDFAGSVY